MKDMMSESANSMEMTEKFLFNPKEGIDNPAMTQLAESEKSVTPAPRLCVLKREEGESFGFHLRVEKGYEGHIFRQIVPLGPAERAGVQDGDRLLEVNEMFVDDIEHPEMAKRIHITGSPLCLLLLDGKAYEQAVAQGLDLRAVARAHRGDAWEPPRLCHITRGSSSCLGLKILPVEGEKGKFSVTPASGGPAEVSGVRKGDRVVWLDGATVSDLSHSAISKMVKKSPDHMTILVIDSKSEQSYATRRMPILPSMAEAHHLPHQPKKVPLTRGEDGYGFLLREERSTSKQICHVVREVDADSPAEKAGLKDGDTLLEVNGELALHMSHDDVVSKIRQGGENVTFTAISSDGQQFFKRLGLSPLLFINEAPVADTPKEEAEPATTELSSTPQPLPVAEAPLPRLCSIAKGPTGYGFHLGCVLQTPGTFISQVAPDGPGEKAGLRKGDTLLEVNGQNVEEEYLEDVIVRIKDGGDSLSVLVREARESETPAKNPSAVTAEETQNTP